MKQRGESAGPLDEGADRGAVEADDQITFPVPGCGSVINLIRAGTDRHVVGDESSA